MFSQEIKPLLSGTITIVTNQKIKFKNLTFQDNQVTFINLETNSEFNYFLPSIRTIEDAAGTIVYSKKEVIAAPPKPKPTLEWIEEKDLLREKNLLRTEIVLQNGNTIQTHIKVSTNMFDPELINELSLNKTIITFNDKTKVKYIAEEIKSMRFVDFNAKKRLFVNNGKELAELLFDGKIRWSRLYSSGGSGVVAASDFMLNVASNEAVGLGGFTNRRKKLKEITKSRPDLVDFIQQMEINDENILALLKKYDE